MDARPRRRGLLLLPPGAHRAYSSRPHRLAQCQGAHDFDKIDYQLRADAGRFECGSLNVPGLLALKGSIDLIAQIGVDAISRQVFSLTESLVSGLRSAGSPSAPPETPASGAAS